jgi:hypothetical protein
MTRLPTGPRVLESLELQWLLIHQSAYWVVWPGWSDWKSARLPVVPTSSERTVHVTYDDAPTRCAIERAQPVEPGG